MTGMTVAEYIEYLKQYPQDSVIATQHSNGDYYPVNRLPRITKVVGMMTSLDDEPLKFSHYVIPVRAKSDTEYDAGSHKPDKIKRVPGKESNIVVL